MPGDPSKVYRIFKGVDHHLVPADGGGHRLRSGWFRCTRGGVSVDDGALTSPEETYARNIPCGVAAIPKSELAKEGLELVMDPEDTAEDLARNPSHRIVKNVGSKPARRITETAEIVIHLEGWQVRGANGSVGSAPPALPPVATPPPPEAKPSPDTRTMPLPFEDPLKK
jgi:hypothetical protein